MILTALVVLCVASTDVTSSAARSRTLLEYIGDRDDLSASDREAWQRAVRSQFGGKAIKDGTDEGVTSAKSVIAAAIFNGIGPKDAAKAAYEAYHDTYRYVPPPIAIGYQILKFAGRAPKASPRELAFNFPRYFNEEMAPDVVRYWVQLLATAKLTTSDRMKIEGALQKTRLLMRPLLLERLWFGAELEAQMMAKEGARADLESLARELAQGFVGVGPPAAAQGTYYGRYAALARELKVGVKPRPDTLAPPPAKLPPSATKPAPQVAPKPVEDKPAPGQPSPLSAFATIVSGWLGVPYLWGGLDKRGVDCSGFTQAVFADAFNVTLPRNSRAQALTGDAVERPGLRAGDLVFFDTLDRGTVSHVGIYVGNDQFVHASSSKGVTRAALTERYYVRAYLSARRVL